MSRVSPAVSRVVAVLNFFAEHPEKPFTLTQVVISLGLSRATAHSILLGLVEAGYLYRRLDKSYILGPTLPMLATRAANAFSPLVVAGQEMRTLADELDVIASALFLEGEEIVVRERAASSNHLGTGDLSVGQRYPGHHLGSMFLIPLPEAEVARRLKVLDPPMPQEAFDRLAAMLRDARRIGFMGSLMPRDDTGEMNRNHVGDFVATFEPDATYDLRFLAAPVVGVNGEALFVIALRFHRRMSGAQAIEAGRRLCDTCARIGGFVRGKLR